MNIEKCKQEYCNWNVCRYYNGPPLDCELNINRSPQTEQAEASSLSDLLAGIAEVEKLYLKCQSIRPDDMSTVEPEECPVSDGCCPECGYFGAYVNHLRKTN